MFCVCVFEYVFLRFIYLLIFFTKLLGGLCPTANKQAKSKQQAATSSERRARDERRAKRRSRRSKKQERKGNT